MLITDEEQAREYVGGLCSPDEMKRLDAFAVMLREASATQNLVARSTLDSVWRRHIADSAQLLEHVSRETGTWLDLGSGAGFPGLVIAIMRPDRDMMLVESRTLRIQWLETLIEELNLTKCRVAGMDLRRLDGFRAGVITARAFAPLPRLIALSARFSTNTTEWVLPKGRSAAQDVAMLPKPLRQRFHVEPSITSDEAGIIVGLGEMSTPS